MNVQEIMTQAREVLTVKRVFGEPYEQDGLTIIPVARIGGGAGGGSGDGTEGKGSGGGFGVGAKPAGVYVLKDGAVRWQPALDVNRVILGGQLVAAMALLTLGAIMTAHVKAAAGRRVAPRWRWLPGWPMIGLARAAL